MRYFFLLALFEIDSEGSIWDFRAPNHSRLYRSPDYFLGKDINQVLPLEAVSIIQKAIKTAKKQGKCHGVEYSLDMNDGTFWFELSISIKGKQKGESARYIAMARDITIRKNSNELLKKASEKLKNEQKELKEKNIALRQILKQIEDERQNYRSQLYLDIDKNIRPVIKRLKNIVKSDKLKEIESIESSLEAILAKDIDKYKSRYSQLTSRESEICSLIETGLSSKQISEKLSLSVLTISKHREQIRKKLKISNKNVNLATYLRTYSKK